MIAQMAPLCRRLIEHDGSPQPLASNPTMVYPLRSSSVSSALAYNSCRNRHCPEPQGWLALAIRQVDLLRCRTSTSSSPLPTPIAEIGFQNKSVGSVLEFHVVRVCDALHLHLDLLTCADAAAIDRQATLGGPRVVGVHQMPESLRNCM